MHMSVQDQTYTIEDLWALSHRGDDKRFELIEGSIVEMAPVGMQHSAVAGMLYRLVDDHAHAHDLGHVTIEAGFVLEANTVVAPDVGFIAKARLAQATPEGYFDAPPDVAAEVVSPSETPAQIRRKVRLYLQAGVQMVWVVYPEDRTIDVHRPGDPLVTVTLAAGDTLEGRDMLPGFAVPVADVFGRLW
jgi:Uma2 family endonuclease